MNGYSEESDMDKLDVFFNANIGDAFGGGSDEHDIYGNRFVKNELACYGWFDMNSALDKFSRLTKGTLALNRHRQSKAAAARNAERARERERLEEEKQKLIDAEKASDYEKTAEINTVKAWLSFRSKWNVLVNSEIRNILEKQYGIEYEGNILQQLGIRIANNHFSYIVNPYGFKKDVLYSACDLEVMQWLSPQSFLAKISQDLSIEDYIFGTQRDDFVFHIRNCYAFNEENMENLSVIKGVCANAYLKYVGVFSYNSVAGSYETVPSFDIVLFFY